MITWKYNNNVLTDKNSRFGRNTTEQTLFDKTHSVKEIIREKKDLVIHHQWDIFYKW